MDAHCTMGVHHWLTEVLVNRFFRSRKIQTVIEPEIFIDRKLQFVQNPNRKGRLTDFTVRLIDFSVRLLVNRSQIIKNYTFLPKFFIFYL